MNDIITIPEERTLGMISMEIRTLQQQAQQVVLGYAIEIGRRLTEAKAMVSHGEWGNWLKEEVRYSKSTANNFMRIFDAYGSSQMSMFGSEAKSQTLGNLPYTKALQLLAIPEEERELFAETNHVEDLSTRELEKLIRERDEAVKDKEAAERRESEAAEKLEVAQATQETTLAALAEARRQGEQAVGALKKEAEAAAKRAEAAEKKLAKERKATDAAREALERAREDLKNLKENPEISADAMEKIRKDAQEAAREAEAKKHKAKAEELEDAVRKAQKEAAEARERAEAAERKLKLADKDLALLQAEAAQLQESFNRCVGYLIKIRDNNAETGEKMTKYLLAVVDAMRGRL